MRGRLVPFLLVTALFSGGAAASGFKAAMVKVDITPTGPQWLLGYPARQSTEVHDPIFHRVVAMESANGGPFILISSDLCAISPAFYDSFAAELEAATGIPSQRIWWTVTHTHSAPEVGPYHLYASFLGERTTHELDANYTSIVRERLMAAVQQAVTSMVPARVGIGTGKALANINRRAADTQGKVRLGLNPYGPVDRQINLIRLEDLNGQPIALIANYAMHGTFLGAVKQVSGDAPGEVASYVERKLGAPMLYINGAAGNVAPLYYFKPNFVALDLMNVLLGDPILEANRLITMTDDLPLLESGERWIETPMKEGLEWPSALEAYQRTAPGGQRLVRVPVSFLKFRDDTVIWSAPLELFSEYSIDIRTQSPFPNTFYFGYSNGWLGYMPTRDAFAEGGYETTVTPYTEAVERDFTQGVVEILQGLGR